jgi:hypothetical protein
MPPPGVDAVTVLAGGGVAGALPGGWTGSQAHALARPLAGVLHSDPPPNDPK